MAENKKSFLLYCDTIYTVSKLPDKDAGELFKHILAYVNDQNPKTDNILVEVTFEPIKQQLKRDLKKYEAICERNNKNGSKGGRPKETKINPENPVGYFGNPKNPNKPDNDTDNDTDKEDKIKDIDEVYYAYPTICPIKLSSTGKSKANKAKIELLLKTNTKDQLLYIIKTYIEDCTKNKVWVKNFKTFLNNIPDYSECSKKEKMSLQDFLKKRSSEMGYTYNQLLFEHSDIQDQLKKEYENI